MDFQQSAPALNPPVILKTNNIIKDDIGYRNLTIIGAWSDGLICARAPLSISHETNLSASDGGNRK
jgi:hypothetical protein